MFLDGNVSFFYIRLFLIIPRQENYLLYSYSTKKNYTEPRIIFCYFSYIIYLFIIILEPNI